MFEEKIKTTIQLLNDRKVLLSDGMTLEEIQKAEKCYEIQFPPDLKALLMGAVPVGNSFYNWRDFSSKNIKYIRNQLNWPL